MMSEQATVKVHEANVECSYCHRPFGDVAVKGYDNNLYCSALCDARAERDEYKALADEMIDSLQKGSGVFMYAESPTELITGLVNQRDDYLDKLRGINGAAPRFLGEVIDVSPTLAAAIGDLRQYLRDAPLDAQEAK